MDNENKLWAPIESFIKPTQKSLLSKLHALKIKKFIDLLFYLPSRVSTVNIAPSCEFLQDNSLNQIVVTIDAITVNRSGKKIARIMAKDKNFCPIFITIFNFYSLDYLKKLFPQGKQIIIEGKFSASPLQVLVVQPSVVNGDHDFILSLSSNYTTLKREYKSVFKLSSTRLASIINNILVNNLNDIKLPEWFSSKLLKQYKLPGFVESFRKIHLSENFSLDIKDPALLRLAFDEMFAFQIKMLSLESNPCNTSIRGYKFASKLDDKVAKLYKNLPFKLTEDQIKALKEIFIDLKSGKQMVRLLQGDVGSGKTIVAVMCAMLAIDNNYQVAILSPTASLARQHHDFIQSLASITGVIPTLLLGQLTAKTKKLVAEKVKQNKPNLIVGTHALLQKNIEFNNLGLVIIDEQHKFGVLQRFQLTAKDYKAHLLMLSATPIPRTLALSNFNYLQISKLNSKPSNRPNIITKALSKDKLPELLFKLKDLVKNGRKIFWICPLIKTQEDKHESDITKNKLELTSVISRYQALQKIFDNKELWLMHAKMPTLEQETTLNQFRLAKSGVLVATTVVEVGIDISDANIIVIEDANRFGLSQLHQLRGRVGRGQSEFTGYCLMLFDKNIGSVAKKRLKIMENESDGFKVAEQDFIIRGGGNILGTMQSGETLFKFATEKLQIKYMPILKNYALALKNTSPLQYQQYLELLNKIFHFNLTDEDFLEVVKKG